MVGHHLDNEAIVIVMTEALYMAISSRHAVYITKKGGGGVETYLDCILAVHEVAKLDPTTLGQTMYFLISDGGLARLFDRAEYAKDFASFIITDSAACDFGEVHRT